MAEVYLGLARGIEGFEKLVVLKRIRPRLAPNGEIVRMFLREARLAALLDHSNIVQIYDIGEQGGHYFYAMEYLHGEDADRILKTARESGRRLPLGAVVAIGTGVAAGLHYAHDLRGADNQPLGLVHRDVSPHNVIVSYDGGVKLVDFGIAKTADCADEQTRSGVLKGKLRYMSPEQVRGLPLDRRCDVFSLGVLLWELIAGGPMWPGRSDFAILDAITGEDPPPLVTYRGDCPPELDHIVGRALARSREARYQTAQELQFALEEFAREGRLAASPLAVSQFMNELFGAKVDAWHTAQRQGISLADHVTMMLERETATVVGSPEAPPKAAQPNLDDTGTTTTTQPEDSLADTIDEAATRVHAGTPTLFATSAYTRYIPRSRVRAQKALLALAAGIAVASLLLALYLARGPALAPQEAPTRAPPAAAPEPGAAATPKPTTTDAAVDAQPRPTRYSIVRRGPHAGKRIPAFSPRNRGRAGASRQDAPK